MITVIVGCFLLFLTISLFLRMMKFYDRNGFGKEYKICFGFMAFSLAAGVTSGVIALWLADTLFCYFFYTVQLFCYTFTLCQIVLLCRDIIGIKAETLSDFVTFLTYSTAIIYFLSTILGKCKLSSSNYGVFFKPEKPLHIVFLYLVLFFAAIVLFAFILFRKTTDNKKRAEHEINLLAITLGSSIIGFLMEFMMIMYVPDRYFDFRPIFYLISGYSYYWLIRYHRSIDLKEEDYEEDLINSSNDVVFIINDEDDIVFVNKRADVLGIIYHDEYIGRKFTDVFKFSKEELELFNDKKITKAFGASAEYVPGNCFVNLVITHRFDRYNEVLTSTVYVYNMESSEDVSTEVKESYLLNGEMESIIEKSREITKNARILLIDENINFLNELQTALEPYEMIVTRAIGGFDGYERVLNGEYDIIFISDGMIQLTAEDTVKRIRANQGRYFAEIPIVFITNSNVNEIFMQMLEVGFSDYLNMKIDAIQLDSVLTKWVWKRQSKNSEPIELKIQ